MNMNGRVSLIVRTFVSPMYLPIVGASVWILLRGHNEPGGGFIGGLVAVLASVALALATTPAEAQRRMPLRSGGRCAALGVVVAGASGLAAVVRHQAFLAHPWTQLLVGDQELALSTVMLFDFGVYLAVWGAIGGYALELMRVDEDEVST